MTKKCIISEHLARFYPDIPDNLMEHIKGCKECSEQLEMIKLFSTVKETYDVEKKEEGCPNDDMFLDFLEGKLEGNERDKIEKHILKCNSCFHLAAEFVKENYPAKETVKELLNKVTPPPNIQKKLKKVKELSLYFINQAYPEESLWFDLVWETMEKALTTSLDISFPNITHALSLGFTRDSENYIAKTILIINEILSGKEKITNQEKLNEVIEKYAKKYNLDKSFKKQIINFLIQAYRF